MPIDQILTEAKDKMTKSESAMMHEFDGVRTGKANPALVENIMAEAYGSTMRLRDMAGITAPETRTILIQPWDAGTVDPINKAIQSANLGLNPSIDGKVIRITLIKVIMISMMIIMLSMRSLMTSTTFHGIIMSIILITIREDQF